MLKRLKIHRFRNVEPGTELHFAERFNVLLGKNGTGKTTLLELISMILRSDFSALRGEPFGIECDLAYEHIDLRIHFKNQRIAYPVEKALSRQEQAKKKSTTPRRVRKAFATHLALTVNIGAQGDHLEIEADDSRMRWREKGNEWSRRVAVDVFAESFLDQLCAWLPPGWQDIFIIQIMSYNGESAYRFDESLQAFDSITSDAPVAKARTGGVPPIGMVRYFGTQPAETMYADTFIPYYFEPKAPLHGQSSAEVEFAPPSPFHDVVLTKFPALAGFSDMTISLAIERSVQEGDFLRWHFGRAEFLFSRAGGTINHHALSYGQKRLLAFLYYLDVSGTYVIADELVNGMHHDWITACIDLIGDRQSFLTSQNPLLLDYIPLESAEQVRRTFIRCTAKTVGERITFVWANLSDDEARELFADYNVGIQPVGELLRVRGLW